MTHNSAEPSLAQVRSSIARHLDLPLNEVLPRHLLREDLGLGRIELTLVAMKLEDQFDIELPFFLMQDIDSVAELSAWIDRLTADDAIPSARAVASR